MVEHTTAVELLKDFGDMFEEQERAAWELIGQGRLEEAWLVFNQLYEITEDTNLHHIVLVNMSLCFLFMLEVDAAERLAQYLVALSGAAGQLPAACLEQQVGLLAAMICVWVEDTRMLGLFNSMPVRIEGVVSEPELNGREGEVKGMDLRMELFSIAVEDRILWLERSKFQLGSYRIVQLEPPECAGTYWVIGARKLSGDKLCSFKYFVDSCLVQLQDFFAIQLNCPCGAVKMLLPDGTPLSVGPSGNGWALVEGTT